MKKTNLKIGQILQINPEIEHKFGGMLVIVTEPKSFGCQGYLLHTGDFEAVRFKDVAYVRVKFEDVESVGFLEWVRKEDMENE